MYKLLFTLFATLVITLDSFSQVIAPNDFAKELLTAFNTKSFQLFKKLSFDTTDYKEFQNNFISHNNVSTAKQQSYKEVEKEFADSAEAKYNREFERLLAKGERLGIDWHQIKYSKFVFHIDKIPNSNLCALFGHINFVYKDTAYVIFGIEAVLFRSGYKQSKITTVLKGSVDRYDVDPDSLNDDDL